MAATFTTTANKKLNFQKLELHYPLVTITNQKLNRHYQLKTIGIWVNSNNICMAKILDSTSETDRCHSQL